MNDKSVDYSSMAMRTYDGEDDDDDYDDDYEEDAMEKGTGAIETANLIKREEDAGGEGKGEGSRRDIVTDAIDDTSSSASSSDSD